MSRPYATLRDVRWLSCDSAITQPHDSFTDEARAARSAGCAAALGAVGAAVELGGDSRGGRLLDA